jgi:hypothetical protein
LQADHLKGMLGKFADKVERVSGEWSQQ